MEGISLHRVGPFWDGWKLVTVRFRPDIHELRFIYANPTAWSVLSGSMKKTGTPPSSYPDGSVFGKVAYSLGDDELFANSRTPGRVIRYSIMEKDEMKHRGNHGWGYAIFSGNGRAEDGGGAEKVAGACASCHEKASARGFVFGLPIETSVHALSVPSQGKEPPPLPAGWVFKTWPVSRYGETFSFVGGDTMEVSEVPPGDVFLGALSEWVPVLARRVHQSRVPAAVMGEDRRLWVVAYPDKKDARCVLTRMRFLTDPPPAEFPEYWVNGKICSEQVEQKKRRD